VRSYCIDSQPNKLIEGKLNDVKRQFKTNTFKVGILDKPEALMQALSQNFSTNPAQFKSLQ
jgi:ABC-2 type transport system ATP-binding protein